MTRALLAALAVAALCAASAGAANVSERQFAPLVRAAWISPAPTCMTAAQMALLNPSLRGSQWQSLGMTSASSPHRMVLLNDVCKGLVHWLHSTASTVTEWDVQSLATLYHESDHQFGVRSERQAECYGVRQALKQVELRYPGLWTYNAKMLLHRARPRTSSVAPAR
jgi:hypothetical protein